MFGHKIHRKLFILFLIILSIGLSMGKLLMSISMIGLSVNWLIEGGFNKKWQLNKIRGYFPLILSGLFIVEILWLVNANDISSGLSSIRIKLPLLVLPIVLGTSTKLNSKELKTITVSFILGLILSSIIAYLVDIGFVDKKTITSTSRDISIFMSHIRYSLVLSFSIFLILSLMINKQINNWLGLFLVLWFGALIYKMSSMTAFLGLFFGLGIFLISIIRYSKKKKIMGITLISLTTLTVLSLNTIITDHYKLKETGKTSDLPQFSKAGEKYLHLNNNTLENGYYVWKNIAVKEVTTQWNKRSKIPFTAKDQKGQSIKNTLYRYLTSKGLKKDKEGVDKLSPADIKAIQGGNTSFVQYNQISKRIRGLLFEIDNFRKTNNPNNHSLTQRILYWKIGIEIFKKHFLIGVGTGNSKVIYKEFYKINKTILSKKNQRYAHNQFLTQLINLGLIGFTLWLLILTIPTIQLMKLKDPLFLSFICLMFIAFLSDDMLERQAGVTIFSSVFYLLIFLNKEENIKELFFLKKNSK
tara:strand:- start:17 stop:1597 length:1581 start_codon:yes stop_codon:yes gene_type:complete